MAGLTRALARGGRAHRHTRAAWTRGHQKNYGKHHMHMTPARRWSWPCLGRCCAKPLDGARRRLKATLGASISQGGNGLGCNLLGAWVIDAGKTRQQPASSSATVPSTHREPFDPQGDVDGAVGRDGRRLCQGATLARVMARASTACVQQKETRAHTHVLTCMCVAGSASPGAIQLCVESAIPGCHASARELGLRAV